jgi:hypothetical protein
MEPEVIGSLEPGKTYVIKVHTRFRTNSDLDAFREELERWAPPGCRFLILDEQADIVSNIPVPEEAPGK